MPEDLSRSGVDARQTHSTLIRDELLSRDAARKALYISAQGT